MLRRVRERGSAADMSSSNLALQLPKYQHNLQLYKPTLSEAWGPVTCSPWHPATQYVHSCPSTTGTLAPFPAGKKLQLIDPCRPHRKKFLERGSPACDPNQTLATLTEITHTEHHETSDRLAGPQSRHHFHFFFCHSQGPARLDHCRYPIRDHRYYRHTSR